LNWRLPGLKDKAGGGVPVPVRATDCGLPGKLSTKVSVATRVPCCDGVNVTAKVAIPPAGIVRGSVGREMWKSLALVPERVMLVMMKSRLLDALVAVIVRGALVVVTCWEPNGRVFGAIAGGPVVPVPTRGRLCGLPPALSVVTKVALRVPAIRGANVSVMLALPLGAIVSGNELPTNVNSLALGPVIDKLLIMSGAVPEFVIGMLTAGEVVSTNWLPTLYGEGGNKITGVVPVPVMGTL